MWLSSVKHLSVYIGRGRFLLGSLVKSLRMGMAQTGFLVPTESLREDITKSKMASSYSTYQTSLMA